MDLKELLLIWPDHFASAFLLQSSGEVGAHHSSSAHSCITDSNILVQFPLTLISPLSTTADYIHPNFSFMRILKLHEYRRDLCLLILFPFLAGSLVTALYRPYRSCAISQPEMR